MRYIDIHCHLDFSDYDKDREEIFARMNKREVGAITIGTDLESSRKAVEITGQNKNVWACVGVHPAPSPLQGEGWGEVEVEFTKLVTNPKVVAIGECGLDYFRIKGEEDKIRQQKLFKQQIEFALKHDKPLMLHCRNSYDDVLEILGSYKTEKLRGNAHFFAGKVEQAKRFLDLDFSVSFTGVITFAHDYDEIIKYLPLDKIMSETDAPFVTPVPHRGKRNEPAYVVEVVKRVAEVKGIDIEIIKVKLLENAIRVFKLKIENCKI